MLAWDTRPTCLPYRYDTKSPHNFTEGLLNRLNLAPPFASNVDKQLVQSIVDQLMTDLDIRPLIERFTFQDSLEWLETRPYPASRKRMIERAARKITARDFDEFRIPHKIQGFIKDETYVKVKPPRIIATRNDAAKFMLGPYFNYIDEHLFNSKYSVKHVPYAERPRVITERFQSHTGKFIVLDYTSFECSSSRQAQRALEYQFYKRIFPKKIYAAMEKHLLCPLTKINGYSLGSALISPVRFSGEMNTSCGNTLYNLMAILYAGRRLGYHLTPLVEGDDSLTPIPEGFPVETFIKELTNLGLMTKYEVVDYHGDAGYCSSYWTRRTAKPRCDMLDFALNILYAPRSSFRALGDELLPSKVTSYAIQYPHTPIIAAFASVLQCRDIVFKYNAYLYEEYLHNAEYITERGPYCLARFKLDLSVSDTDYAEFCRVNHLRLDQVRIIEEMILQRKFVAAMNRLVLLLRPPNYFALKAATRARFSGRNVLCHVNEETQDHHRRAINVKLKTKRPFRGLCSTGLSAYSKLSSVGVVSHPNWVDLYQRRASAPCQGRTQMSSSPVSRWYRTKHPLLYVAVTSSHQFHRTLRRRRGTTFSQ